MISDTYDNSNNPENYVSKNHVAKHLGVTERTIELWHHRGFPHYKFGTRRTRYKISEVDAYMATRCRIGITH
jgi:excisionase family DNA binding protein